MSTWNQGTALWFQEQERTVRRDFWAKLKHFAGQVPFVEDVVAAYYCALDPATPMRVRGILLAALVYFIFRLRARPLTWLSRLPALGFTDDAAVLTAVFGLSAHITPVHRAAAARALGKENQAAKLLNAAGEELLAEEADALTVKVSLAEAALHPLLP